jgi:hypothetical protein
MVLSPSAGSSHRVTGVKCIPIVRVPSGSAAAGALISHSTASMIGERHRMRRKDLMCRAGVEASKNKLTIVVIMADALFCVTCAASIHSGAHEVVGGTLSTRNNLRTR